MAQVDYYLKIDGIDGEATDDKHKGWIELQSWSWGETNSGSFGSGKSGGGAGKVNMQDFHFVTGFSSASPNLTLACAAGSHPASAILECCKAGDPQQLFLKITLTEVMVTSYQTGGSGHSELIPTDQVSLAFDKVKIEYGPQDAGGKVASLSVKAGWDVGANKKM